MEIVFLLQYNLYRKKKYNNCIYLAYSHIVEQIKKQCLYELYQKDKKQKAR
jgi:hypothetical protein